MERDAHDLVGGLTFRTEQDRIAQLERQCARPCSSSAFTCVERTTSFGSSAGWPSQQPEEGNHRVSTLAFGSIEVHNESIVEASWSVVPRITSRPSHATMDSVAYPPELKAEHKESVSSAVHVDVRLSNQRSPRFVSS